MARNAADAYRRRWMLRSSPIAGFHKRSWDERYDDVMMTSSSLIFALTLSLLLFASLFSFLFVIIPLSWWRHHYSFSPVLFLACSCSFCFSLLFSLLLSIIIMTSSLPMKHSLWWRHGWQHHHELIHPSFFSSLFLRLLKNGLIWVGDSQTTFCNDLLRNDDVIRRKTLTTNDDVTPSHSYVITLLATTPESDRRMTNDDVIMT